MLDTVYSYNVNEGSWRTDTVPPFPQTANEQPWTRTSASAAVCAFEGNRVLYIVGGMSICPTDDSTLCILDNTLAWDLERSVCFSSPFSSLLSSRKYLVQGEHMVHLPHFPMSCAPGACAWCKLRTVQSKAVH
jgi:hypothetical protein